ncbi:hypothetical protein RBB78_19950 [Tunturiibacter empetritectus]|uniref:hypothetical protein n=1 Tax=Tunturiibacter empetritectus TaxID=3069691 RepID=UPI003D9B25A2
MCGDLTAADETISDDEEDGAEGVEDGVERGKEGEMSACYVDRRVVIDKPREKERCDRANGDDRSDDSRGVRYSGLTCCVDEGMGLEEQASFGVEHHCG